MRVREPSEYVLHRLVLPIKGLPGTKLFVKRLGPVESGPHLSGQDNRTRKEQPRSLGNVSVPEDVEQ